MAVTILNEMNVAGQLDDLLSPFMKPVLYFKATGAGAVTSPEAEMEIVGTSETLNFKATFLQTLANEHYFHVDLSNMMKHILRYFDNTEKPDDIVMPAAGLTAFTDYWRAVDIDIYFERGTGDEQTLTVAKNWIYLANQMPSQYGFNLVNISNALNLSGARFKWGKDSYGAIFFWHESGNIKLTNVTNANTVIHNSAGNAQGYYQYKFSKAVTPFLTGVNQIKFENTALGFTYYFYVDYDPDCAYINLLWQHPFHGYVSYAFNGSSSDNRTFKKGEELNKFLTTLADINTLKENLGYDIERKIQVSTKAHQNYFSQLQEIHGSRHVYMFVGASGDADSSRSWIECIVSGGNQVRSNRSKETFTVELLLPEYFNIKY